MITYFTQLDPRWSRNRIGLSWLTVGNAGCVCTCLAMLASYIGSLTTPAQVAANKSWFFFGKILWWMVKIPHLKFIRREYGRNDKNIVDAINGDPNTFVFLQIKNPRIKEHWLWATGVVDGGKDYHAADPLTGEKVSVIAKYGTITGAAYWKKI